MAMDLSGFVQKKTTIKIGTKDFIFSELCLKDLAEFRAHLIKQRDDLNEQRRKRLIGDAEKIGNIDPVELLKLSDTNISDDEVEAQMETVEGIGYLAYLSLRYTHQEISKEDTMRIITPNLIEKIVPAILPTSEDGKKKQTPKKQIKSKK